MRLLDAYTLFVITTLLGGGMGIVLYAAHRNYPPEVRGVGHWAAGIGLLFLAAVFFALQGPLPQWVALLASNLLIIGGSGLTMIGTEKFYGMRNSWRLFGAVELLSACGMLYWLLVEPNFGARVVWMGLMATALDVRHLYVVWHAGEKNLATRFFGGLMATQTVMTFVRAMIALYGEVASTDLSSPGPFQSAYLVVGSFVTILTTLAFIIVANQHVHRVLERRAVSDPLTGVLNRRGFAEAYAKQLSHMRRGERKLALLSIDLDRFKAINDTHGHAVGDKVLVSAAKLIGSALRDSDLLARFGGEEFIVLLPETGTAQAVQVGERILAILRAQRTDGLPVYTASIGVACQLNPTLDMDGVLGKADNALYRAKAAGRDRLEVDA
jgi:diguanylate cyclase (GGDEF)-like protein